MTRREATRLIAGGAAGLLVSPAIRAEEKGAMVQRPIPSSGELLPVIGLGTARAFDVSASPADRQPVEEVLALFAKHGGKLVDSSPMYGRAELVVGEIAKKLKLGDSLFLATKVWTTGREQGIKQMEHSLDLLGQKKLDLIQVHNLVDTGTQLATLREWKKSGRVRYIGITHHTEESQDEVASVWKRSRSISCRSITRSWNAKRRSAFCRWRKIAAWPCSSIAPSAAAICSGACAAKELCRIGRRSLIALPGRNFS